MMTAARDIHDTLHAQIAYHVGQVHYCRGKALITRSISQFAVTVVTPGIHLSIRYIAVIGILRTGFLYMSYI